MWCRSTFVYTRLRWNMTYQYVEGGTCFNNLFVRGFAMNEQPPVQHTKSNLGSVCTPIGAATCRTDAVSGPGRRRIPLSPDSLPSPATPFKLPQPPRDTRKEKISWNPFHTSDCRHYLLGCKARREVEILKIASIRFLFITHQATLFEVLSAAEWEVTSHSTAEPPLNHRIQISWFCSPASRYGANQLHLFGPILISSALSITGSQNAHHLGHFTDVHLLIGTA